MVLSNARWMLPLAGKMDAALRREIIGCYRHGKRVPCFLHGIIRKARFMFKKLDIIVRNNDGVKLKVHKDK